MEDSNPVTDRDLDGPMPTWLRWMPLVVPLSAAFLCACILVVLNEL